MPQDALEQAVLAQLRAVVLPARAMGAAMATAGTGSIVVVSSGLARDPQPGFCDLSVTKAAVVGAARDVAGAVALLASPLAGFCTGAY